MVRLTAAIAAFSCLAVAPGLLADGRAGCDDAASSPVSAPQPPAHLLVVRLSSDLFRPRDPERRQVDETTPVRQTVLGSEAVGTARVRGRVDVDFFPHRSDTGLWLNFSGTCVARTVAQERAAIIHTTVASEFVCRKPLLFDLEQGFRCGNAASEVRIISTRRCVDASVGGIRGRLVRRIAHRRLNSLDGYLNRVTYGNTRRRIETSFDRETEVRLAALNRMFQGLRLAIAARSPGQSEGKLDVSLNTTDQYLQIGIGPKGAPNPRLPDTEVPKLPVQVWLQAAVFGSEAAPLLQQWDNLRLLLPRRSNVSGILSTVRVRDHEESLPLELFVQDPWVVITAGRPREGKNTSDVVGGPIRR